MSSSPAEPPLESSPSSSPPAPPSESPSSDTFPQSPPAPVPAPSPPPPPFPPAATPVPLPSSTSSPSPTPSASTLTLPSPGFPSSPPPASSPISTLPSPSSSSSGGSKSLAVGLSVGGVVVLLLLLGIAGVYWFKKKKKKTPPTSDKGGAPPSPINPPENIDHHVVKISPSPPSPTFALGSSRSCTFTYEELEMATDGFSDANLLGHGGFGDVHKGVLPTGREVAVKQLRAGSYQGEREFQAEVEVISRVHHKHLVSLVGYCVAGGSRLLVYEFISNNSLEFHLHGKEGPALDWPTRLKIAIGSGKGLAYLHEDCRPKIIHRDIKSANILLDDKFEAMVADFGLAKIASDNNTHVSTRVMGTFGYLAPEYASSGKLTDKSDVFSYGVMLFELISGRRPSDTNQLSMHDSLVDWARPLLARALNDGNYDSFVDPKLNKDYNRKEMARMIACIAACMRHSARRRPRMSLVVRALEGEVSLEDLNEGLKPGHSEIYSLQDASDYDSGKYGDVIKNMKEQGLGRSGENVSSEAASTNEYVINPSVSSSEGRHTEEMKQKNMEGR